MNPALILGILSLLLGSGLLVMVVSFIRKDAVRSYQHDEMQKMMGVQDNAITSLKTSHALMEQKLNSFDNKLSKLDLLERVDANVQHLMTATSQMLPRPEAEAELRAIRERVENVEQAVFHKAD